MDKMSDQKKIESEKLTLKLASGSKRGYEEAHFSDDEIDIINSSFSYGQSNGSFSSKRFKAYSYRDQNTESQDTDSLRNTLGSPGLTDSLDSGTWNNASTSSPSASKNPSLASLELSSIIQRYDNATLNSLTMSQMSCYSDDARTSPFSQTVDMTSPTTPNGLPSLELNSLVQKCDNATANSISWSQVSMMSCSQDSITYPASETEEMASLSSQPSQTGARENSCGLLEAKHASVPSARNDEETKHNTSTSPAVDYGPRNNRSAGVAVSEENLNRHEHQRDKNLLDEKISSSQKVICREKDKMNKTEDCHSKREDPPNIEKNKDDSDSDLNTSISIQNESNPELKENFKTCKKNPGHEKFFSPKELKVTDLPPDIQHEDSVTFFQCLSNLVVQISVSGTSDKRGEDDIYSSYIGTNKERNGSGFIASTDEHIMRIQCTSKDCPHKVSKVEGDETAKACESSGFDRTLSNVSTCSSASTSSNDSIGSSGQVKKHFVYGGVYVRTNRHVIFDKSEADCACVNFFFHSSDRKDVVKGHVASIHGVNNDQDHIILHVMSHDKRLLDIVGLHLKNAKSSYVQMIKSTHSTQQYYGRNKLSWVGVISHPHGTANSVSFGRLKKEEAQVKRVIKYYDAATCPGSSGGLVVTPTLLHLQWPGAVHSSFCQKTKFNVSLDSRFQELDKSVIWQMNKNILNKKDSVAENQYKL